MKAQTLAERPAPAKNIIGIAALALGAIVLFARVYPIGVDWDETFGQIPRFWHDLYANERFTSPPWVAVLLPHAWLPLSWGNAVNLMLNLTALFLLIRKYGGDWGSILLTFTSPLFLDLLRTNNVEWIPIAGLLLPAAWGIPLLAIKPQVFGNIVLIWWKQGNYNFKIFIPVLITLALSFLFWGNWLIRTGLPSNSSFWNFAPFPLGIPFGVYIIYKAWKTGDEVLAAVSTPLFFPYIAPYSLAAVLALLSTRYRREALFMYAAFWFYFIIEARRLGAGI